jgi:hypothetical protein
MDNVIKFEDLEVEVLIGIANESAELVEASARKTVEHAERCGRALLAAKEKLPHGKFTAWLGSNFDYSERHAQRYMHIASNTTRVADLKHATSIREALRMIAEDPETPKRERKPAVEVIEVAADEPRDIAAEVAAECGVTREQIIRDGEYAEALDIVSQVDPDIQAKVRSGKVTQDDVIAAAKAKSSPVKATEAKAPASPQQVSPPPERKPPSVQHIGQRLMRLGKDKKKHDQLMQIAELSLHYVTVQERIDWLSSQLIRMSANDRLAVFRDVSRRIAAVITE